MDKQHIRHCRRKSGELADTSIEIIQIEIQTEKLLEQNDQSIREWWDFKQLNTYLIGARKRKDKTKKLKK